MKKRGIFSVVLLLSLATLFGTQNFTDIGKTYGLEISDQALAKAEVNSASTVTVITKEQIEAYNAPTTADLVGKAIGTTYNSYGALGAAQSVQIRGTNASKTLVYLDGVLLNNAHSASFDLSSIPVASIESIEIIKSGSGNLGRTNAIGGIINIITTKGTSSPTPFTFSIENGSFLPQSYGSERNWLGLVDSQKLDLTYSDEIKGISIVSSIGGILAQNGYIYESGGTRALRDNAGVYNVHGSANISGAINDMTDISSNTIISYQDLKTPGDLFDLTPNDFQKDFSLTTANSVVLKNNYIPRLKTLIFDISYDYRQTHVKSTYEDWLTFTDVIAYSTHKKHKGSSGIIQKWETGENYALESGVNVALDYVDSTEVGINERLTPSLFINGSVYLLDGKLSLHPNGNLLYLSDTKVFSPNASFGIVYELIPQLVTKASISYAEYIPDFSQLYWPFMGNPNLQTEKGLNFDIGLHYSNELITYEGIGFFRNIDNAIASDINWVPQNIAHSMYFGTEQSVALQISQAWSISASYQLNKSYDLSGSNTLSDNVEVASIRKHTAKAAVTFEMGMFQAILDGEVLGKSINMPTNLFLCNLMVNAHFSETLKAYIGVDNLLNTQYEHIAGYPMPGMKVRLGGDWKF